MNINNEQERLDANKLKDIINQNNDNEKYLLSL